MGQQAVDSLRRELGDGYELRYPRMPEEDDPSYARWSAAIWREMTCSRDFRTKLSRLRMLTCTPLSSPQAHLHRLPGRDHQLEMT